MKFKCPQCGADLSDVPRHVEAEDFVVRVPFRCEQGCKWRGWIGISVEEFEDKVYNDVHIQMALNRLHELRGSMQDRRRTGARLSDLLNALDRLTGEL